jgi:hypothetical protein
LPRRSSATHPKSGKRSTARRLQLAQLIPSRNERPNSKLPNPYSDNHRALNGLVRILRTVKPQRLVLAGGPRRGKSHLAKQLLRDGVRYHHGEELVGLEWSAGSELASRWLDEPGRWICENVAMARALRKWLKRNPTGKPADLIVNLRHPADDRVQGQETMAVGCETVWREILPELQRRGVRILEAR